MNLLDLAYQLAEEQREGEFHKAHLQHEKRAGRATQEQVNEVEHDLEFLRRHLRITLDRAEAIIKSVELPEAEISPMLASVRARLKGE